MVAIEFTLRVPGRFMFADVHCSYRRAAVLSGLIIVTMFTGAASGPASLSQSQSQSCPNASAPKARLAENYGRLPLSFESNMGQADQRVKFVSRGDSYELYLTGDEAVLGFPPHVGASSAGPGANAVGGGPNRAVGLNAVGASWDRASHGANAVGASWDRASHGLNAVGASWDRASHGANAVGASWDRASHGPNAVRPYGDPAVLWLRLAGANREAVVMGGEKLPGTTNYFIGNDPRAWRRGIPTYATVRYTGIYPGIDLVYYGNQRQLEFDFLVAPHADARRIRLRVGPPAGLHLAANGDLVVDTANGTLAFHKPAVYQTFDGHRHPVAGNFALLGKHTVGFRLGSYDRGKALVIDPVLAYSTFLGGTGGANGVGDAASAVTVDDSGSAYVTGTTCSTDFPVTPGAFQTSNHAGANKGCNAFVSKLNPSGTALVYSTYLGGSQSDAGTAIAVDSQGNAYVAGRTYSTDFPVTTGVFQAVNHAAANNNSNAFIAKLNADGSALEYSTYVGGSGLPAETSSVGDTANAIAVDLSGDAYMTGRTYSTDFPVTQGAFQTTNHAAANTHSNAFVTELNPGHCAALLDVPGRQRRQPNRFLRRRGQCNRGGWRRRCVCGRPSGLK